MLDKTKNFVELINSSRFAVVLTGAGISTESGIPDYRSPETGIWNNIDQSVVSIDGFLKNPKKYYDYALGLYLIRSSAEPNPAHYMLAELEKKGFLKGIITQNVDGLHLLAGSLNVHELHGSLRQTVCLDCSLLIPSEEVMVRVKEGENPPSCDDCGGVLKPNAVFFGERLPKIPWLESVDLVKKADLFICIGSSLSVSPANVLPDFALKNGAKLVIINLAETPYDMDAELVVKEKIAVFSKKILENF